MNRLDKLRQVLEEADLTPAPIPRAPTTRDRLKQQERAMEDQGDANVFFNRPDPRIVPRIEQEAKMMYGTGNDLASLRSGGFGAQGLSMARPPMAGAGMGSAGMAPAAPVPMAPAGAGTAMPRAPMGRGIPPEVLQMIMARAGGGGAPQGPMGMGAPRQGGVDVGALLALLRQRMGGGGMGV